MSSLFKANRYINSRISYSHMTITLLIHAFENIYNNRSIFFFLFFSFSPLPDTLNIKIKQFPILFLLLYSSKLKLKNFQIPKEQKIRNYLSACIMTIVTKDKQFIGCNIVIITRN